MGKMTTTVFVAIPVSKLATSAKIARAFDPDIGGENSFDIIRATKDGVTYAIAYSPATPETAAGLSYFKTVPGLLYQTVMRDYEARWGELTPPTLAQCEDFRTSITLAIGKSFHTALAEGGFVLLGEA